MNWLDVIERAIWTFIQGSLGAAASLPLVTDVEGLRIFAIAAITGGVSAVLSFIKTVAQERLALPDTRAELGG